MAYVNLRRICLTVFLATALSINAYAFDMAINGGSFGSSSFGPASPRGGGISQADNVNIRVPLSGGGHMTMGPAGITRSWGASSVARAARGVLKVGKARQCPHLALA